MRLGSCLVLFAGVVLAIELPAVPANERIARPTPFQRMRVELDGRGRLRWNKQTINLNEFKAHLTRHHEERGIWLRRKGKPSIETIDGFKASPLHLDLAVDKTAPWRHVQWILMVAVEVRVAKTGFITVNAEGNQGLTPAPLPLGLMVTDAIDISVDDEPARTKPNKKGRTIVVVRRKGEAVYYEYKGKATNDLELLAKALETPARRAAAKKKGRDIQAEIQAESNVPTGKVLEVYLRFKKLGFSRIDFYGSAIPDKKTRIARRLPPPK